MMAGTRIRNGVERRHRVLFCGTVCTVSDVSRATKQRSSNNNNNYYYYYYYYY